MIGSTRVSDSKVQTLAAGKSLVFNWKRVEGKRAYHPLSFKPAIDFRKLLSRNENIEETSLKNRSYLWRQFP